MNLRIPPALKHRRFRLLWGGHMISVAGSRMQFFALLWHIRELTDLPIALGLIGVARIVPIMIFSLIGGAVADAYNRRRVLFITQSVQVLIALTLGLMTLFDVLSLWHIYAFTAIQAAAFSFDLPARQSLTPNLVPAKVLPNAFSMQAIAYTTGAIVGPMLTGIVLATPWLGQPYTYLFNAVSYLGIIAALYLMGPVAQEQDTSAQRGINLPAIREGVRFIAQKPIILSSMLLDFVATFFSSATALLPIFARDILVVGEMGYGWLSAAEFIGAALAAIVISQLGDIRRQGRVMLVSVVVYGIATAIFGIANNFVLAMFALMFVGAGDTVSAIIRRTARQMQTPDYMRGRMTSINQIFFMGGPQLGEVEAGLAAQFFGAPIAVFSGGILCVFSVAWINRRWPQLRRYNGDEAVLAGVVGD
ncbi:MAG: MFS transporter [Chloroflexi bacterium]|nr:MFS transporter [Chloroflexota bacterium]